MDNEQIAKVGEILLELQERGVLPKMRIEYFQDQIVMLAAPRWEHNRVVQLITRQVDNAELYALTSQDVVLTDGSEPIPDLVVLRDPPAPGAKPLASDTELLVEVCSRSNHRSDYAFKCERYAEAGVPEYLLVDPRHATCLRFRRPDPGKRSWRERAEFSFGEEIDLLCLPKALVTAEFPTYE